ncbi:MAG: hypothetical protein M3Z56_10740 [Bacteroidota bacterium]|nr:hypothetical protein [Bacteroidota bacterium]
MQSFLARPNNFPTNAFVSCSLRSEDKPFIDLIERVLSAHYIQPFGTVGRYSALPENPALSMRDNIAFADMVVVVATERYLQQDTKTGARSYGLSEMVHVESGMAFAMKKPVIVFSKAGTNVGNFLPNITQYITLTGEQEDLDDKWHLINSLLANAYVFVQANKTKKSNKEMGDLVKGVLTVIGFASVFNYLQEG